MTEKQIENTKKKIRSHRAKLNGEKRKFGCYDDSYGRRYLIAELYVKIADFKGALNYFKWFEKEFEDDIGFPEFLLFWALTLFENKKIDKAKQKTFAVLFSNIYLLEILCEKKPRYLDFKGNSNIVTLDFAESVKLNCMKLLTDNFRLWLKEFIENEEYEEALAEFVSLDNLLQDERPGDMRSNLIEQGQIMKNKYIMD